MYADDVAPLTGSVDRNFSLVPAGPVQGVAPLTGSGGRNVLHCKDQGEIVGVAPLTGSVDRNMISDLLYFVMVLVAPLTGSVDRNWRVAGFSIANVPSLPSRGAWIEITSTRCSAAPMVSRSPHGERG